ncbi:universal stress protein [Nocardioides sp. Y6]|uniref:Universal stress protein n=1 Tax=Nocardioides malaquae TaxID=2773426 RepID=A0ABR9RUD8_9ACTN|nr:universal stress protein [Nocardioides malaquae]MBE7325167.1 universal stress protein [Nocardioides malaquae]
MTVVVGYMPNEFGEAALAAGVREARRRGTRLLVVNATLGDTYVDDRFVGTSAVPALRERLDSYDVPIEFRQEMGSGVSQLLVEAARDADAQVLVIGLRPRTPIGKMIMGSVAQRVLLDAPCAVLAVKPGARGT